MEIEFKLSSSKGTITSSKLLPLPPPWSQYKGDRQSAVLCLIATTPNNPKEHFLLLTKRTTKVRTHKGQIGFPGGHREESDNNPSETALRETYEEIGLLPEQINLVGSLPSVNSLAGKAVVPIVGTATVNKDQLIISEDEVDQVILAPIEIFLENQGQNLSFNLFGIQRKTYHYRHESHIVWGLTAKMIQSAEFRGHSHSR